MNLDIGSAFYCHVFAVFKGVVSYEDSGGYCSTNAIVGWNYIYPEIITNSTFNCHSFRDNVEGIGVYSSSCSFFERSNIPFCFASVIICCNDLMDDRRVLSDSKSPSIRMLAIWNTTLM